MLLKINNTIHRFQTLSSPFFFTIYTVFTIIYSKINVNGKNLTYSNQISYSSVRWLLTLSRIHSRENVCLQRCRYGPLIKSSPQYCTFLISNIILQSASYHKIHSLFILKQIIFTNYKQKGFMLVRLITSRPRWGIRGLKKFLRWNILKKFL